MSLLTRLKSGAATFTNNGLYRRRWPVSVAGSTITAIPIIGAIQFIVSRLLLALRARPVRFRISRDVRSFTGFFELVTPNNEISFAVPFFGCNWHDRVFTACFGDCFFTA